MLHHVASLKFWLCRQLYGYICFIVSLLAMHIMLIPVPNVVGLLKWMVNVRMLALHLDTA